MTCIVNRYNGKNAVRNPRPVRGGYPGSKGGRPSKNPERNRISLAPVNLPPPAEEDDDDGVH